MRNLLFLVLVVVALALSEAVYHFVRYLSEQKQEELRRRLRMMGNAAGPGIMRSRKLAKAQWLSDALAGIPFMERLERLLEQTDLELSVARLCSASVALAGAGAGVAIFFRNPLLSPVAALLLGSVPLLMVFNARAKRGARISSQLPDALEMMARSIKAGHALPSSLKMVAQDCPAPVAVEFARAFEQQNLGLPFEQAILNITGRVPSNMDLRLFAVSVVIQKETGGNMVEVLENIASTMRERFRFYSKLRALVAEGKISGIILGSLPFAVAFLVLLTNPGYLKPLGEGMGRVILVSGLCSWSLGVLWIRSLMKVDY